MATLEKVVIKVEGDSKALDPTITKLQKLGKIDKNNAASFKKTSKEFQESTKESTSLLKGLGKQALVMGTALIGAFAIKQVVGDAIKILKDFEKEMSTLRSITGSTVKEMEFFKKAAFEIGRATKTAGIEVVKAFTIIGSAQPELLKNQKALAAVTEQALILAKAAGIDTVQAADALTSAMNQFGASADDAAKFTDIFATSQQKGSSFIVDTSEALRMAGASADATGLSFETTTAAIQALAKGAIRGSMAGTSLNAVLAQLSKQNDDKINPSVVGLAAALEELEKRNLSFKDATKLVQIEGAKGLLTLIKQRDIFEELNGNLNETGNAMEQMRINTDNLDGSLDELSNAYAEFITGQDDGLPVLRLATDALTGFLNLMTDTDKLMGEMRLNVKLLEKDLGRELTLFEQGKIALFGFNEEQQKLIIQRRIALKIIKELNEENEEETEITEKSTAATKIAVSALKVLKKRITELKRELEEQALAGNLSKDTLIEYAKATKKAKDATILLTDAIADLGFEFKRLKPIREDLQKITADDITLGEFLEKERQRNAEEEAERIALIKANRRNAANVAIEAEEALFHVISNINEGKLIGIENERKAAIKSLESRGLAEGELADERLRITKQFDRERAAILTKQAKADQIAALITAAINVAIGVTAALEVPPPAGIVLAALVGVIGAAEIATIAAQPIPTFHKGKRGEQSDEEIPALIKKSEYVIPSEQSRKHSAELDAMLQNKFERFVFMKYQMPIIKQYSNQADQIPYDDFDHKRNQRKQIGLLSENNKLLRGMIPSMKRASHNW
ncbi:hypothetical protein LCGC14_0463970 [marine sediment metagenome]|uniref:Phage tail tape measure protein domain-containing protein n=1 Tax=marine sediment metagenome TaxID=412755 RepID=A0A0F9SJK1_9ZZZZ